MSFIEIKDKDGKIVRAISKDRIVFVRREDFTVQDIWSGKDKIVFKSVILFDDGSSMSADVPIEDIIYQFKDSQAEPKSLSNTPSWLNDMMVQPPFS